MYGQMTAGSWIYIGSQGIVQGTYETFVEAGRQHYGGDLAGKLDPDRGSRRHGRRAAAGRDDGRRVDARDRMPAEPHRDAAANRYLDAQAATWTRRWRHRATRREHGAGLGRPARQRGGGAAGTACGAACGRTSSPTRPRRTTVNGYLPRGLDASSEWQARAARSRAARRRCRSASARWSTHVQAMLEFHAHGHADLRLRQQHPPGGEATRAWPTRSLSRASCPPTSGRCSAAAWARSAGRRSPAIRRTSPHRRKVKELFPDDAQLHRWLDMAGSASSSRACRRASAGSGWASGIGRACAFNEMVATRRTQGADRDRPRSSRHRLGRVARTARPRR